MAPTLCLSMIVRDEAEIIEATLANILDHLSIDYFVISDTGSTDQTAAVIEAFFADRGIPGEVHHDEWRDFSYNRNLALDYALGKSDYILVFDADDRFEGDFHLPDLTADAYYVKLRNGGTHYERQLIFRNSKDFRYRGVLHEVIYGPSGAVIETIEGNYAVISGRFGARSQRDDKYYQDALVLARAFYDETEPEFLKSRYAFYAARSYRDADYYEEAVEWYHRRIALGGWKGELVQSYLDLGQAYLKLDQPAEAVYYWMQGYNLDPHQIQCLYQVVSHYRSIGDYYLAFELANLIKDRPIPTENTLFLDKTVYRFWIYYEIMRSARHVGEPWAGFAACRQAVFANEELYWRLLALEELWHYRDQLERASADDVLAFYLVIENVVSQRPSEQLQALLAYCRTLPAIVDYLKQ